MRHGFGHTRQVSSSSDIQNPADGLAPAAGPPAGALQLSELEVALLALLSIRPMTGYEILRHHARALEPWWEAPRRGPAPSRPASCWTPSAASASAGREPFRPGIRIEVGDGRGHCGGGRVPV